MHDSHRRCEFAGCTKWPLYAFEGEKAKYCSQHKDEGMVDVRSRRCQEPSCTRQPSFGFEHQKPRFCAAHKDAGMVDVVSRRCEEAECRRRPLYGHEGEKGRFCSYHKIWCVGQKCHDPVQSEGMVDVVNKRCQHVGCKKRPVFGFEGEKGRFCSLHRSGGMVDVVSRRCDSPGCKRQPSGTTDATQVQFCSLHRGDGRAGYTLLMLAQRERIAAQAALEETQKQQRARAPISGSSWPGGEDMAFPDYRSRWEGTSPGSSASFSTNGAPTPGSGGSFPQPSPSGSFLSNQHRNNDGSTLGDQGNYGPDSQTAKHNPNQWLWTAAPRGSSVGPRRPPPLKNPSDAGVLGIAGRPPQAPDSLGDSPGNDWTKPTSAPTQGIYPAKRHCSPRRRSFSHSPEPGSRSMVGMPANMASSPASPNMGAIMGMSSATSGTPSPSGAMGIPTPPGSSGSAALPPPHGAPRRSAQRLPQPQFPTRALPRSSSGGPPRPPRSLSPGGLTARSNSEGLYAVSSSGRSPVSNVGFSPSGPQSASSVGGFSGVFSPGNLSVASGGGPSSASPRWASPRRRAFGHSRTRSQGSVADTLEDLSIVDPGPPTLEPLRVFPAPGPLRSPRDRWRGGLPDRRNSEIILPLPDRTQPEPGPGPVSDSRRRSFTASLFDQPGGRQIAPDGKVDAMDTVEGGEGASAGITSGGSAGAIVGNGGEGADIGGGRWEPGLWTSTPGEGGDFQMMSAGYRQQAWPQQMQAGSGGGDHGDAHVEEKETRRNSHMSVGTMPLTSTESLGDREGSVFFSAES